MLADAVRLVIGMLTVVPVGPPRLVDRRRAALAMTLAPPAGAGVGVAVAAVAAAASRVGAPDQVTAVTVVAAAALVTRFLHLDGLADTADGLAAAVHGNATRGLEVMRRGDAGPVAVAVLTLTLVLQIAALAVILDRPGHSGAGRADLLIWVWAVSRACVPLLCSPPSRPARSEGLGALVLGTVPPAGSVAVALVTVGCGLWLSWPVALAGAGALVVTVLLAAGAARRLGGLTGDVLGAGVEVTLTVLLVAVSVPAVGGA